MDKATRSGPPGTRFFEIRTFEEIDSTNRYLVDEARRGSQEGLVAQARYQTAGRGRLGRRWEAPPGANLLASLLLRPKLPSGLLQLLTASVALAAVDACEAISQVSPEIKWPNDLVIGSRKLAGILAEADLGAGGPSAVVVGIGLNVGWPAPGDGAEPQFPSTSLWRESLLRPTPDELLDGLLARLEPRLAALDDTGGRLDIAGEYRRRCSTLGQRVQVELPGAGKEAQPSYEKGIAVDLSAEGHLIVDNGVCLKTILAGDVVHLRAI